MENRRWQELRVLGAGSFSKVVLMQDPTRGEHFVVKHIEESLSPEQKDRIMRETSYLPALRHPGIVAFRETMEKNGLLCLVTDYADGGDLEQFLCKQCQIGDLLPEGQVLRWLAQLCAALSYMHDRHVLHRDIKASNVFLRRLSREVQLGDFGISTLLDLRAAAATQNASSQSASYWSPERLLGRPHVAASDIWSLGVLAYELCTLRRPFASACFESLGELILEGSYTPLCEQSYSQELHSTISDMLSPTMDCRPTASDLQELQLLRAAAFGPPPRLPPMMMRPVVDNNMETVELESASTPPQSAGAAVGASKPSGQRQAAWAFGDGIQRQTVPSSGNFTSEVRPVTPDMFRPITPDDNHISHLTAPAWKGQGHGVGTMRVSFSDEFDNLPGGMPMVELIDDEVEELSQCTEVLDSGSKTPKTAWGHSPRKNEAQQVMEHTSVVTADEPLPQQQVVQPPPPRQGGIGKAIFRGARRLLGLEAHGSRSRIDVSDDQH